MTSCLVVFDVDSTLIDNEVIELIADHAGTRDRVADITERAMRGELDFAQSLRERVATLEGVSTDVFAEVLASISVTEGVRDAIAQIHELGGCVAAVSGGFHEILDTLAGALNLDMWRANRLETLEGRITGKVDGAIIDAQAKADAAAEWARALNLDMSNVIAVGDGANDLKMMALAGTGVAFCAKPVVNEHADVVISMRDMRELIPIVKSVLA